MSRQPRPTSNLPAALDPLFGREELAQSIVDLFEGGRRVVSLVGPGGIGKSRLALEVARRLLPLHAGGVFRCELADASDRESALRVVARATATGPLPSSARDPSGGAALEVVARRLAESGPTLLLLDDADAVIEPAATLVRACVDAGAARFLVTSREALGIEGERVVDVAPLSREAALAMFEELAGGGPWKSEELGALLEQLDGLPLAIELAARRSRLVPPGDLLARLGEAFRLLKTDRRDVAARHATLTATIEWSLARLDADESRAFAGLGVFEGSFTVEALEAVVGPLLLGDPVDAAEALLRKSLIASVATEGAARLTMLRTLRAFARERLKAFAPAEREATELRHATFYVEHAEAASTRSYGADAVHALDALEADVPNVLRAFEAQKDHRHDLAARAIVALGDLVVLRNVVDVRSAVFREARAAADVHGDARLRVQTRIVEAKVTLELAGAAVAETLLVEAVAIADAAKLDDAADARRSLAWARIALGQAESALGLLEEALVVHRATGNVRGEADALAARGLTRCLRGELAEGHGDLENAYALHVMARDAIRREKVLEMAQVVGLQLAPDAEDQSESRAERIARLAAAAEAHRASGRPWREAVARFQLAALESTGAPPQSLPDGSTHAAAAWLVGPEARWIRPPGSEPLDLTRHGSLRRVLDALVTRRLLEPSIAMSAIDLLAAGWPDERVRHESGMLRVYSAVRRLRALGLGSALVTRDDGYLLDPSLVFERGESATAQ